MDKQFYRVTLNDAAYDLKNRPENNEVDESQLAKLNETLPTPEGLGLQVIAFENVRRESDFDLEDSRKWMVSLDVKLIISSDEATAKLLVPFDLVPSNLAMISSLLDQVSASMPGPKLKFSGEWVVAEIAPANDFEPEPAAPTL